jgi:hypothetical protein
MSSITTEVPSPVFKSICALAETEGVPVERLASLAIAQAVAVWCSQKREFDRRAARGNRDRFAAAMNKVPAAQPQVDDE